MSVCLHKDLVLYELSPEGALLGRDLTAPDIIGQTYEADPDIIVVPVSRLAPSFLDLSTRVAGEVFQKMEQYGRRLVIKGDITTEVAASTALHAFVYETNRRGHHLFVPDHESLIVRLG